MSKVFKSRKFWLATFMLAVVACGFWVAATQKSLSTKSNVTEEIQTTRHPALKDEEVYRKMREKEGEAWRRSNQNSNR